MIHLAPDQIKTALTPVLLEAFEVTTTQADRKYHLLCFAVIILVGTVIAIVAETISG